MLLHQVRWGGQIHQRHIWQLFFSSQLWRHGLTPGFELMGNPGNLWTDFASDDQVGSKLKILWSQNLRAGDKMVQLGDPAGHTLHFQVRASSLYVFVAFVAAHTFSCCDFLLTRCYFHTSLSEVVATLQLALVFGASGPFAVLPNWAWTACFSLSLLSRYRESWVTQSKSLPPKVRIRISQGTASPGCLGGVGRHGTSLTIGTSVGLTSGVQRLFIKIRFALTVIKTSF